MQKYHPFCERQDVKSEACTENLPVMTEGVQGRITGCRMGNVVCQKGEKGRFEN